MAYRGWSGCRPCRWVERIFHCPQGCKVHLGSIQLACLVERFFCLLNITPENQLKLQPGPPARVLRCRTCPRARRTLEAVSQAQSEHVRSSRLRNWFTLRFCRSSCSFAILRRASPLRGSTFMASSKSYKTGMLKSQSWS